MAKKQKKKARSKRFAVGMIIYAVVFLILAAVGLRFFWKYIDAYEQSRPKNTVEAYMDALTPEKMCDSAEALLAQVDPNVQSREQARQVILDSLTGELTYAKKTSESSDDRQVYVIRCGRQVVGQMAICAGVPDAYGFRNWSVEEESFDFSYLEGTAVSITVPSEYTVSVSGNVLDESYITEADIPYTALEEFYDDYELPTMVTYTADSFLGEIAFEVADPDGEPVEITAETEMDDFVRTCSDAEIEEIDALMDKFVTLYVAFTGESTGTVQRNYYNLCKVLVSNGELAKRLYKAFDGLTYAQSKGDVIKGLTMNQYARMDDERFMCDITYVIETTGKKGAVETTTNMKVVILNTDSGLKVEAYNVY